MSNLRTYRYKYYGPDTCEPRLAGRRLRALMHFLTSASSYTVLAVETEMADGEERGVGAYGFLFGTENMEPAQLLAHLTAMRPPELDAVPVTVHPSGIYRGGRDPELSTMFQDLAYQVAWDLHLACDAAFTGRPYPGVLRGIEPVSDEHVRKVIAATQRELDRELRSFRGKKRPAVRLDTLPWPIQRAFAERRRLRYRQWGITAERWQKNTMSLFDIPEDSSWVPQFPVPASRFDEANYFIAY